MDAIYLNMLASSTCISCAVVLFNPLDCLRIRWQVVSNISTMSAEPIANLSLRGYVLRVLRNEGLWRGLWVPGVGSNALGAFVSRGIGMGCYPAVRDALCGVKAEDTASQRASRKSAGLMFLSGLLSGGLGYGISTPAWLVKSRLQAGMESEKGPAFRHGLEGLRKVFSGPDGLVGAYRGAGALVVRGGLMNAGNTLGYDFTKTWWKRHFDDGTTEHSSLSRKPGRGQEGLGLHVMSSVVAAFLSSTFSVPADVVLTRYQAASEMGRSYKGGVVDCIAVLYREGGFRGFFRGWTPLFVRVAPLYVCYLPLYEQFRKALGLGYLD